MKKSLRNGLIGLLTIYQSITGCQSINQNYLRAVKNDDSVVETENGIESFACEKYRNPKEISIKRRVVGHRANKLARTHISKSNREYEIPNTRIVQNDNTICAIVKVDYKQ
jgi:hypothetical protein